jgi:hypothetical protein
MFLEGILCLFLENPFYKRGILMSDFITMLRNAEKLDQNKMYKESDLMLKEALKVYSQTIPRGAMDWLVALNQALALGYPLDITGIMPILNNILYQSRLKEIEEKIDSVKFEKEKPVLMGTDTNPTTDPAIRYVGLTPGDSSKSYKERDLATHLISPSLEALTGLPFVQGLIQGTLQIRGYTFKNGQWQRALQKSLPIGYHTTLTDFGLNNKNVAKPQW